MRKLFKEAAFAASIDCGIASCDHSLVRNEANGARRASSHQLRLIGFANDKRRKGGPEKKWRNTETKHGERENQFQKWMRYDPLLRLIVAAAFFPETELIVTLL